MAGTNADENTRGLLRFITCGSVDDGKSTLLGRFPMISSPRWSMTVADYAPIADRPIAYSSISRY